MDRIPALLSLEILYKSVLSAGLHGVNGMLIIHNS